MRKLAAFALMTALVTLLATCGEKECDQTMSNPAGFGFYTINNEAQVDTSITDLVVYPEARQDSFLYDSVTTSTVFLPLNPTNDFTRFIFVIDSVQTTLEVTYSREQEFISHPCGFTTTYRINGVSFTNARFDSVQVINHIVSLNTNEEHFNIFLSPADTASVN